MTTRLLCLTGKRERDAQEMVVRALRSIRDQGAATALILIERPNGSRDVYTSTQDADKAVGMLHRAAAAFVRAASEGD
jgi:hypothetical protein